MDDEETADLSRRLPATLDVHMALHELRSPLTAISMQLASMHMDSLEGWTPGQRKALDALDASLERYGRLLTDLAEVADLDVTRATPQLEMQRLDHLVAEVVDEFQCTALDERIHMYLDFEQAVALADAHRLKQVLRNLINNALRHTDAGGNITLRVRNDRGAIIEVEDDGTGWPADIEERLFEPYQRGEAAPGWAGLGLFFSRRIIDQHGGTLTGHSRGEGRGSRFTIQLPSL